jgi:hypothetical protein
MLYIQLKSKIAEEAGDGHTIFTIYDGELINVPLPWRPQDGNFAQIANVSKAFIVYHPIKEKKARILRGIMKDRRIGFPNPYVHSHKAVDYEVFKQYFNSLSEGRTEGELSLPEFRRFAHCPELAQILSDVPYPLEFM